MLNLITKMNDFELNLEFMLVHSAKLILKLNKLLKQFILLII